MRRLEFAQHRSQGTHVLRIGSYPMAWIYARPTGEETPVVIVEGSSVPEGLHIGIQLLLPQNGTLKIRECAALPPRKLSGDSPFDNLAVRKVLVVSRLTQNQELQCRRFVLGAYPNGEILAINVDHRSAAPMHGRIARPAAPDGHDAFGNAT